MSNKLQALFPGESKNDFCELLVHLRSAGPSGNLTRIDGSGRLQIEMTFPDENGPGDNPIHGSQEGQNALLKVKRAHIPGQIALVESKAVTQADVAQFAVDRI